MSFQRYRRYSYSFDELQGRVSLGLGVTHWHTRDTFKIQAPQIIKSS